MTELWLVDLEPRGPGARSACARNGGSSVATPKQIEAVARRIAGEAGALVRDLKLPPGLFGAVALGQGMRVQRERAFLTDGPAIARLLAPRRTTDRGR